MDPDGRWTLYSRWVDVPRRRGRLAVLVAFPLEQRAPVLLECHATDDLRETARQRLRAVAGWFVASDYCRNGGLLRFGVRWR